jgi:hypothetical protein
MKKNFVFLHLVDLQGSKFIAYELIDELIKTGLADQSEIFVYCNYDESKFDWLKEKVKDKKSFNLFFQKNNPRNVEIPTLIELEKFCEDLDEESNILYMHHKGASQPYNVCVADWRKLMMHFTITHWKKCVEELETNDVVGVNWRVRPYNHFSGNFWWAKSSYIKQLPKLDLPEKYNYESQFNFKLPWGDGYRHDAEFWIGLSKPKQFCLHRTDFGEEIDDWFNHYTTRYPKEKYDRH